MRTLLGLVSLGLALPARAELLVSADAGVMSVTQAVLRHHACSGALDRCGTRCRADADADGVCDIDDACPGTVLPEPVPDRELGLYRWADLDGDGVFDTRPSNGKAAADNFTLEDTAGCSCAQIADALALGDGHRRQGCSPGVMAEWVASH